MIQDVLTYFTLAFAVAFLVKQILFQKEKNQQKLWRRL